MKTVILFVTLLTTSMSFAAPAESQPEVKDSMELFNRLEVAPAPQQPTKPSANGRIWSLAKIAKKYQPENMEQTLLDIALETAPERSKKMKVFRVTRVASGSIYDQAGVKVGDYVAQ